MAASFVGFMGFHNGQYGQQHSSCCAATCAIEMLERAPRDVSEMGSKPLVRFAHSAVAVPTNFGGKPSTVRSISLYTPRVPPLLSCPQNMHKSTDTQLLCAGYLSPTSTGSQVHLSDWVTVPELLFMHQDRAGGSFTVQEADGRVLSVLQEMVIFGGVSPDTDFNDIAVWRPGRQPTRISTHG